MAIRELKDQIARLPEQPGVYLYFNAAGETIYVGKARALRDRVRNYLGAYGTSPKTDALLDEIARLEVIVTDSVVEALALENNLIKQRSPSYNILLRDDKNYPYLQLTTNEAFPRVLVARRVERDGSFYAGPFMPARFARRTMGLTHRLFGIRSCNEVITGKRDRPCLEYDIKRCIAPCVDSICSADAYGQAVAVTRLFLEGKNDELLKTLQARMVDAATAERFEEAAQLRDSIRTIQTLQDRQQKITTTELGHRDVFGLKLGPAGAVVQVFQVRRGHVVERIELGTEAGHRGSRRARGAVGRDPAVLRGPGRTVRGARADRAGRTRRARELALGDRRTPGAHRRAAAGREARPRGARRRATPRSAIRTGSTRPTSAQYDALETLRAVLELPALPRRIECFDISTIQGSETVASMVVCEDGRMRRGEYRKFRIKGPGAGPSGARDPGTRGLGGSRRAREPHAPLSGRLRRDAPGRRAPVPHGARAGRTVSRLDSDRRRARAALRRLRGAGGARSGQPRGRRDREEGGAAVHAAATWTRSPWPPTIRRCCSCSASATKRTGLP